MQTPLEHASAIGYPKKWLQFRLLGPFPALCPSGVTLSLSGVKTIFDIEKAIEAFHVNFSRSGRDYAAKSSTDFKSRRRCASRRCSRDNIGIKGSHGKRT